MPASRKLARYQRSKQIGVMSQKKERERKRTAKFSARTAEKRHRKQPPCGARIGLLRLLSDLLMSTKAKEFKGEARGKEGKGRATSAESGSLVHSGGSSGVKGLSQ